MGSDLALSDDYGQDRELGVLAFGVGGRPHANARVEKVLAGYLEAPDAVLVPGAGTGAIRAMINAALQPGQHLLLHDAPVYMTALPAMQHTGLQISHADFNDAAGLRTALSDNPPDALYLQYVPQQLGDRGDPDEIIRTAADCGGIPVRADDNYAVMR